MCLSLLVDILLDFIFSTPNLAGRPWKHSEICTGGFIYKTPLGLVPSCLCSCLQRTNSRFAFCPCDVLLVPQLALDWVKEFWVLLPSLSGTRSRPNRSRQSSTHRTPLDLDRHACVFKLFSELQHFFMLLCNVCLNCSCICFKLIGCELLIILFVDVLLTTWPGQHSERYFGSRQANYLIK